MNALHVTTTSTSWAHQVGVNDAQDNAPFAPEFWFASPTQKRDYALGFESVKGVSVATAQFTGNVVPAPIQVPNYKRNVGREFIRRIDSDVAAIFKANEAHDKRMQAILDKTAALSPEYAGDFLWAV